MSNIMQLKKLYDSKERRVQSQAIPEEFLSAIKEEAYNNGFNAAQKEALSQQAFIQKEINENLNAAITKCMEEQNKIQTDLSNLTLCLSIKLFKKVLPAYVEKAGTDEVISFIETNLTQLQNLSELTITVHPENVVSTEAKCLQIVSENNLKIQLFIKGSDELELTDCIINWGNGHIEKILNNIITSLDTATSKTKNEAVNEVIKEITLESVDEKIDQAADVVEHTTGSEIITEEIKETVCKA